MLAGRTIVVDVTPILPGGYNGGAKHFVQELVSGLAEAEPDARFVLLTHARSHEDLSRLDRPNVRRVLAVGGRADKDDGSKRTAHRSGTVRGLYDKYNAMLPGVVQRGVIRAAYAMNGWRKRGRGRSVVSSLGADLLFCPFTAPTFHERSVPMLCTLYDLQFAAYPQFFDSADYAYRRCVLLDAASKATVLAAISDFSRERAIEYTGIAPERIETVYLRMAGRLHRAGDGRREVLASLGIEPGNYLLYPANFWKHKQHEMLLTAFGVACHRGLPAGMRLVLTGAPGERRDYLSAAARAMGLGDRVVFPGYVDDEDLGCILQHARGLVFPSLYEGFGLPVLEAMACGVPVACSESTALAEVASGAALLFDPRRPHEVAGAIRRLVLDEALRSDLTARGRTRAAFFSNKAEMVSDYRRLMQKAISSGGAVGGGGGSVGEKEVRPQ